MKAAAFFIMLIFGSLFLNGQKVDSGKVDLFVGKCSSLYKGKGYDISQKKVVSNSKQLFAEPAFSKVRNEGFKKATLLFFKSPKKTKQNVNLSFKVAIYHYSIENYAVQKFEELTKVRQTQDESVLGKSYNYLFLDNNCIYRIEAGCIYSRKEWADLKTKFVQAQSSLGSQEKHKVIECFCGAVCL